MFVGVLWNFSYQLSYKLEVPSPLTENRTQATVRCFDILTQEKAASGGGDFNTCATVLPSPDPLYSVADNRSNKPFLTRQIGLRKRNPCAVSSHVLEWTLNRVQIWLTLGSAPPIPTWITRFDPFPSIFFPLQGSSDGPPVTCSAFRLQASCCCRVTGDAQSQHCRPPPQSGPACLC